MGGGKLNGKKLPLRGWNAGEIFGAFQAQRISWGEGGVRKQNKR